VADGKVVFSGWLRGYGNLIIVDHGDGYHTVVAHLGELERKVGEEVHGGDALGPLGDTGSLKGPYVYFELRHRGVAVDPQVWLTH
jgi:murein hydrolase activator